MSAAEQVSAQPSHVKQSSWKDYAVRFAFGGLITVAVGIVGKTFGPVVAGLFLAFPAILPASVTLVQQHEGKDAAGSDALGAAAGSVGLLAFGAVVWALAPRATAWIVLISATAIWLVVSVVVWWAASGLRKPGS